MRALVVLLLGVGLLIASFALYRRWKSAKEWSPPSGDPAFSASLDEVSRKYPQLKRFLDDPKYASVLKEFVAAYHQGGIDGAKRFAVDRGFMNAAGDITITVVPESPNTTELEAELTRMKVEVLGKRAAGIDILIPFKVIEDEISAGATPDQVLEKLANVKNVRGLLPTSNDLPMQRPGHGAKSEGVHSTRADEWNKAGYRGQGVRVGVLDPEVSHAQTHIGKNLPDSTEVYMGACTTRSGRSIDDEGLHGVAAAEIVHEMAPDAEIFLACSRGDIDLAINWLLAKKVKIISYSAGGMFGPRDGTGELQATIDRLAARGILWVNANGNEGDVTHRGHLAGGDSGFVHTFSSGNDKMGVRTGSSGELKVTLNWGQWGSSTLSDYDLYLVDRSNVEVARSQNANRYLKIPMEQIQTKSLSPNTLYYVQVRARSRVAATNFVLNAHGARQIELPAKEGTLASPADAQGALSVGAVSRSTGKITQYSSRGPTEDGRLKPDISAPTEVSNFVYDGSFAGTSSAAPHVTGAAAVIWGRSPEWSRDKVLQFLLGRAKEQGAPGPDVEYGYGKLDLGDPSNLEVAVVPLVPRAPPKTAPSQPAPVSDDEGEGDSGAVAAALILVFVMGILGMVVLVGGIMLLVKLLSPPKRRAPAMAFAGHAGAHFPHFPVTPFGQPQAPHAPRAAPPAPAAPAQPRAPSVSAKTEFQMPAMAVLSGTARHVPPTPSTPPPPQWRARLMGIQGAVAGHAMALYPGRHLIGSGPAAACRLADAYPEHAAIEVGAEGCVLVDFGTPHGTWVEGRRVQRHLLRHGERVTIGSSTLVFEVSG